MKCFLIGLLVLSFSSATLGGSVSALRERVELSMLVTGQLTVGPDGSVASYVVDHSEKLPPPVLQLLARDVRYWRFKPLLQQGHPVAAKFGMTLRVIASHVDQTHFALSIHGATFGSYGQHGDNLAKQPGFGRMPHYPDEAARMHVTGTVYLLFQLDAQGKVLHVAAKQVNLGVLGSDRELAPWREMLASASIKVAHGWDFHAVAAQRQTSMGNWYAIVPVNYSLGPPGQDRAAAKYGQWHAYMLGPREVISWLPPAHLAGLDADAVAEGGIAMLGEGPKLLTPLSHG